MVFEVWFSVTRKMKTIIILFALVCSVQSAVSNSMEKNSSINYATPEYLDILLKSKQYEKFCQLLRIDDVERVRPSRGKRDTPVGDILYQPVGDILYQHPSTDVITYSIKKWKNNEVPYFICSGFSSSDKAAINSAIIKWNEVVPYVKFRRSEPSDKDYVFFYNGNGCYSYIGRKGGPQDLSLNSNACGMYIRSILHEMMHAIGIPHEHERHDRDTYIRVNFQNIPKDLKDQFKKVYIRGFGPSGEYDYYSIMHYQMIMGGKQVFSVLKENVKTDLIGKGPMLTVKDLWNVKQLYGDTTTTAVSVKSEQ